jgi:type IV pilus assembly protein PilE
MEHAMRIKSFRSRSTLATRKPGGFTLIELMIAVAIVAILMAIAIPNYQNQVRKSRRTSAKTALLDVAGREEKYYATNNNYPASLSSVGYTNVDGSGALQVPNNTNEDYYSVKISLATAPATGFTATATPVGDQKKDSCGSFSVTDLGVQTATGSTGGSGCW